MMYSADQVSDYEDGSSHSSGMSVSSEDSGPDGNVTSSALFRVYQTKLPYMDFRPPDYSPL